MNKETRAQFVELMHETQVATLAVLVDAGPFTGLLPFALGPDLQVIWIHASDLARHTRGLQPGAPFSLLIYASPRSEEDPLQTSRISLQGNVARLDKDSRAYELAQQSYTRKYPQSAMMFTFNDFNIYELQVTQGRFVAGFAKAFNLTPELLAALGRGVGEK